MTEEYHASKLKILSDVHECLHAIETIMLCFFLFFVIERVIKLSTIYCKSVTVRGSQSKYATQCDDVTT